MTDIRNEEHKSDTVINETKPSYEEELAQLDSRSQSGAKWFYWVAVLSVVNTVIMIANGSWSFIFGLSATQFVDAVVYEIALGEAEGAALIKAIGFGVNIVVAGVFALFGRLAMRRKMWAFATGTVFYTLDAFLSLVFQDFLGLAFHAWVLFGLVMGLKACYARGHLEKAHLRESEIVERTAAL